MFSSGSGLLLQSLVHKPAINEAQPSDSDPYETGQLLLGRMEILAEKPPTLVFPPKKIAEDIPRKKPVTNGCVHHLMVEVTNGRSHYW